TIHLFALVSSFEFALFVPSVQKSKSNCNRVDVLALGLIVLGLTFVIPGLASRNAENPDPKLLKEKCEERDGMMFRFSLGSAVHIVESSEIPRRLPFIPKNHFVDMLPEAQFSDLEPGQSL